MRLEGQLERLAPLIEVLVNAPDASQRHRMILDAISDADIAEGGALWSEHGSDQQFKLLASMGEAGSVLSTDQVQAIANGELDRGIGGQSMILVGKSPIRIALSLNGIDEPELWEDMLEAVLVLAWQFNSPWPVEEPLDLVDTLLAPFQHDLGQMPGALGDEIDSLLSLMREDPQEGAEGNDAA
ncbi:MAG: hypothetical protein ACI841_004095 [Planctomycetota bacterium]|jgi:hypothetical protein